MNPSANNSPHWQLPLLVIIYSADESKLSAFTFNITTITTISQVSPG